MYGDNKKSLKLLQLAMFTIDPMSVMWNILPPKENVTQNPTERFSIFQGQGLHCFASVLMLYNGLTKHDLKGY